jgi:hypothetical protein
MEAAVRVMPNLGLQLTRARRAPPQARRTRRCDIIVNCQVVAAPRPRSPGPSQLALAAETMVRWADERETRSAATFEPVLNVNALEAGEVLHVRRH